MEFSGSKVALFCGSKLAVYRRDDKPGIPNRNMWDFFGGGREGDETPIACAIREIEEETGITLAPGAFVWERAYPAVDDPDRLGHFFVAHLTEEEAGSIVLTEGQHWHFMEVGEFLAQEDAVEGMKVRLRDYVAEGME